MTSDSGRALTFVMALPAEKIYLGQGRNRVVLNAREAVRLIDAIPELWEEPRAVAPSKARLLRYPIMRDPA